MVISRVVSVIEMHMNVLNFDEIRTHDLLSHRAPIEFKGYRGHLCP
jgi:hypothetical protein